MAVDWDSGNGFFDKLGKLVAMSNASSGQLATTTANGIVKQANDLQALLEVGDDKVGEAVDRLVKGRMTDTLASATKESVDTLFLEILIQDIAVTENLPQRTITTLLPELRRLMIRDSETVLARQYSSALLALAATAGNSFGGVVSATDYRADNDGREIGHLAAGNASRYEQRGVATQSWRIVCEADSSQGLTEGNEQWGVVGQGVKGLPGTPTWFHRGRVATVFGTTSQAGSLLTNGGFESVDASGLPTSWTIAGGGVQTATDFVFRGSRSLRFRSGGGIIRQALPIGSIRPTRKYAISFLYRRTSATNVVNAAISWTINGSMNADNQTISLNNTVGVGEWARVNQFFNTKQNLPLDSNINFGVFGIPNDPAAWIAVDELIIAEIPWIEGIYPIILPGTSDQRAVAGDSFTISSARAISETDGRFQTWMDRWYGYPLPNVNSGNTINDALAAPS